MDVHPPHEPVHNWREAATHIAIMTVGLFIALMLESGVEWLHHRHIVKEARENIRQEIEENRAEVRKDQKYLDEDIARMRHNIEVEHVVRDNPKAIPKGEMMFTMSWSSMDDAAWRSSRDMGALTYMPYADVKALSEVYAQQDIVNESAITIFSKQSLAATPFFIEKDPSMISHEDAQTLIHDTAAVLIGLMTEKQLLDQLDAQYADALKTLG